MSGADRRRAVRAVRAARAQKGSPFERLGGFGRVDPLGGRSSEARGDGGARGDSESLQHRRHVLLDRLLADAELAQKVKERAEERVAPMLNYLDQQLASSGGPYLMGQQISVADFYLFMLGRWSRGMRKPARDYPHLGAFMRDMFEREAIQRVFTQEGLQAPFF